MILLLIILNTLYTSYPTPSSKKQIPILLAMDGELPPGSRHLLSVIFGHTDNHSQSLGFQFVHLVLWLFLTSANKLPIGGSETTRYTKKERQRRSHRTSYSLLLK